MSGGRFGYNQYRINDIADDINKLIHTNNIKDEWDSCNNFSDKTIEVFKNAEYVLRLASILAHRIDWLVSGDDGEDTFHEQLKEDVDELKEINGKLD